MHFNSWQSDKSQSHFNRNRVHSSTEKWQWQCSGGLCLSMVKVAGVNKPLAYLFVHTIINWLMFLLLLLTALLVYTVQFKSPNSILMNWVRALQYGVGKVYNPAGRQSSRMRKPVNGSKPQSYPSVNNLICLTIFSSEHFYGFSFSRKTNFLVSLFATKNEGIYWNKLIHLGKQPEQSWAPNIFHEPLLLPSDFLCSLCYVPKTGSETFLCFLFLFCN